MRALSSPCSRPPSRSRPPPPRRTPRSWWPRSGSRPCAAPCATAAGGEFVWVSEYGQPYLLRSTRHEQGRRTHDDRHRLVRARLRRRLAVDRRHELEHHQPRLDDTHRRLKAIPGRHHALRRDVRVRRRPGRPRTSMACSSESTRHATRSSRAGRSRGDRGGRSVRLGLGRRAERRRPRRPGDEQGGRDDPGRGRRRLDCRLERRSVGDEPGRARADRPADERRRRHRKLPAGPARRPGRRRRQGLGAADLAGTRSRSSTRPRTPSSRR